MEQPWVHSWNDIPRQFRKCGNCRLRRTAGHEIGVCQLDLTPVEMQDKACDMLPNFFTPELWCKIKKARECRLALKKGKKK